jgi:proteasome lid subunit RPN8/RPN11
MINESKIRISPPEMGKPSRSRIPVGRVRRWHSQYETDTDMAKPAVSVYVTQKAYIRFCAHAGTDLDQEVGGGLVGKWRRDALTDEQFILVEGVIPARHVRQGATFLTFTQDTLVTMNDELEKHYPGKQLVGWYHTHPRMAVFLSGYDVFLHQNFFPEPWQVALVMEPHSIQGGFFIRQQDGHFDPKQYFGFYEVQAAADRNVVHWTNLQPEEEGLAEEPVLASSPEEGGQI